MGDQLPVAIPGRVLRLILYRIWDGFDAVTRSSAPAGSSGADSEILRDVSVMNPISSSLSLERAMEKLTGVNGVSRIVKFTCRNKMVYFCRRRYHIIENRMKMKRPIFCMCTAMQKSVVCFQRVLKPFPVISAFPALIMPPVLNAEGILFFHSVFPAFHRI